MNQVEIKVLKDENGNIRVKYHWFIHDPNGAIDTKAASKVMPGNLQYARIRGRIACQPEENSLAPKMLGAVYCPMMITDDVRAATCPKCLATAEAKEALRILGETLDIAKEAAS